MRAPIILFVYRRLDHVKKVIDALKNNKESSESELYIFSDEGKDKETIEQVKKVREYLKTINGFLSVHIIERKENMGIEQSELEGISTVIKEYKAAIILEDDIEVSPSFLNFMNSSLEKYKDSKEVFSIAGYSYLRNTDISQKSKTGFIGITSSWGWATWEDRWNMLCDDITLEDIQKLKDHRLRQKFDYGYNFSEMLILQYMQNYITWDIKWYWTAFINNKLILTPYRTMVNNLGMDGTGVHYTKAIEDVYFENLEIVNKIEFPVKIEEDKRLRKLVMSQLNIMKKSNVKSLKSIVYNMLYSLRIDYLLYKIESSELEKRGVRNKNCKNITFKLIQSIKKTS